MEYSGCFNVSEDVPLDSADIATLERNLRAQRKACEKELREELALTRAALAHVQRGADVPALCPRPTGDLCTYLAAVSNDLKMGLDGDAAENQAPPELRVLDFALASLPMWAQDIPLPAAEVTALRQHLSGQRKALLLTHARQRTLVLAALQEVGRWSKATGIVGFPINRALRQKADELAAELQGRSVSIEPPSRLQVIDYALASLPSWGREARLSHVEAEAMRVYLERRRRAMQQPVATTPAPARDAGPAAAPPLPAAGPTPVPPSVPPLRRPVLSFDWANWRDHIWGLVASGALLKGLLFLGAFMIVIASAVLVTRYWSQFPSIAKLVFVGTVPMAFYGIGFVLRKWFAAPVAGGVFTGIGALLVAADFVIVYQEGGLAGVVDRRMYWLVASVFCTIIYALTAWRLPSEFFGYVTLAGVCSTTLALTSLARPALEWYIAALNAAAVGTIWVSAWLHRAPERWQELAKAAWRLPFFLIPVCQTLSLVFFVSGDAWLGQMATFLLAALGYAWLAFDPRCSPKLAAVLAHASVWSTILTVGFARCALALPPQWYPAAAAVLALACGLASRVLTSGSKTGRFAAQGLLAREYRLGLEWAGYVLTSLAVLGGFAALALGVVRIAPGYVQAGIVPLTLAALNLTLYAYLYRRPVLVLVAGGLFIVPFSVAIIHYGLDRRVVAQWRAWLMVAWMGLALSYLVAAVLLRRAERYVTWLNLWALVLTPLALIGLSYNWVMAVQDNGLNVAPTLMALGGVILVYVVSAVIHDSGRHPALSVYAKLLPHEIQAAIFLWPLGFLLPLWLALVWWSSGNDWPRFGVLLAALGLVYVGLGHVLARRKVAYRLPPHAYAYALGAAGVVVAQGEPQALMVSLLLAVGILASLAAVYRRVGETALVALLFLWPFHIGLQLSPLPEDTYTLAYSLLASLGYIPLGLLLEKVGRQFALPEYIIGYGLSALALAVVLIARMWPDAGAITWVGVAVPLVIGASQVWSVFISKRQEFAWTAVLVLAIAYGQSLAFLGVAPAYHAAAWVSLALVYLVSERSLAWKTAGTRPDGEQAWCRAFQWPLGTGIAVLCALGFSLTIDQTLWALAGQALPMRRYPPLLLAQGLAVGLTFLAARAYRSRWPLYVEPWLAFFPVTLFFIAYGGRLIGAGVSGTPSNVSAYALAWAALALVQLCLAAAVDDAPARYAHGLYLGGYGLGLLAISWALQGETALFWTLGLGIAAAIGSAWLVHLGRHRTWDELMASLFGPQPSTGCRVARAAFLWFAAGIFPIWCVLLLRQVGVTGLQQWLGLAGSALLLLGLTQWLRRVERSYAWPLHSFAQIYTAAGLIICAPPSARLIVENLTGRFTLPSGAPDASALILSSALGVVFYAGSAWVFRNHLLTHVAAWLSILPYTLAWMVHGPTLDPAQFARVWMGWAGLLLGLGLLLDRRRARHAHERYAHGPYVVGYFLGSFALLWSAQDLLTSLYTLAAAIALAATSQLLLHAGLHRSFDDFVRFVWRAPGKVAESVTREVFLFFAVYGFPVWLMLLLGYHQVPLAWRGVVLALFAPLFIACGLAARRIRSTYAWPFYSAGYAFTAISAMLTSGDRELTIYTLTLNTAVYAVSAYIFVQPFWLYLSTALGPLIALLTLDYHQALTAPWVAGFFMALSFLYFAAGQRLDRRSGHASGTVSPFAMPFYAPSYLLSAIALVVASAEKSLALAIYAAGAALYAVSAWALREPLFLYPAVWLTTVPYYLLMTLTPLHSRWYGLGWLPLIIVCITAGRYAFPARQPRIGDLRVLLPALARPATPFYLLAYGLTLLMVAISWQDQLVLACAFAAATVVYLASAALFRRPAWLYPGLAAAHASLATGTSFYFSAASAHAIALPFLALTWTLALVGLFFSRRATPKRPTMGDWAFTGHLAAPGWASPFFQFVAFDLIFWQLVALPAVDKTVVLGVGYATLLALFATLWVDAALVYAALGYLLLTLGSAFRWAELPFAFRMACMAVSGFGLYLLAWIIESLSPWIRLRVGAVDVWSRPLTRVAIGATALAVVATIPTVVTYTDATAAALAAAGALALTIAYRRRHPPLGYAGAAMLLLAWVLILAANKVSQPQFYAIPVGLYLVTIGVLERRQASRPFALYVESFGLTVLLLTSFIQSVDADTGLPYFLLLLVQGLLIVVWGAVRRVKIPFFVGIGTSVFNVAAQLIILLVAARRASARGDPLLVAVLIVLTVGLVLCLLAIVVERQRARLLAHAQEWRVALDTWD